ncbi:MAG: hypothetical protein JNM78_12990 [Cyclobacteriaceae bacterium]|nr:hypothetical protein [Cyclobacteriaceae bacterium]
MNKLSLLLNLMVLVVGCSLSKAIPLPHPKAIHFEEAIVLKMKLILAPLLKENEDYVISEFNITEASGGYRVKGTATLFQINSVSFEGTFSSADVMARFELQFPGGSKLPEKTQQKLAKQNIVNWIPEDIRNISELKLLYMEFAENTITKVGIQFAGQQSWNLIKGISATNILIDFNLNNPINGVSVSSTVTSNIKIGDVAMAVSATLSSNANECVLKGDIGDLKLGSVLSSMGLSKAPDWPDAIWNLSMTKGSLSIAPYAKSLSLNATSDFGQVEFSINASNPSTEFIFGVAPPADFSFARFDSKLGVLDHVGLKNTAIVLASSTQKTNLTIFKKLGQESEVTRGVTLLALYDISAVSRELEKLMGKSQLLLRTALSNDPAEIKLMVALNASIPLDTKSNVILKNISFVMTPNPASFTIELIGNMDVKAEKKTLTFETKVAIDITNVELSVAGIMKGVWDNPFDAHGVQLIDLGIGVGASFKTTPIPLPVLQFKGKIKVGNPKTPAFAGDVTFAMDPSNPTQSLIDAGFDKILFKDLITATSPKIKIPEQIEKTVNTISITDARLTIVPATTAVQVLGNTYDPGFLVKGKSTIDGYATELLVSISKNGIEGGANMTGIVYAPYFSFTGASSNPNPNFYISLSASNPMSSKLAISGKATVLKLSAESDMMLSDKGFDLYMNGKIFDQFNAKLQIAGKSTKDGAGYNVSATLDSDLQKYISEIASAEIDKATKDSQKAFKDAQKTLTDKQKEVSGLNSEIDKQRTIVKADRDKDCKKFNDAEEQVKKDRKKLKGIKEDIDDKEDKIKKLEKEIDKDKLKAVDNGPKLVKLRTEITALQIAKGTANGVLKASEKVLEGLGAGCDLTPIDLDPRIAGLITARETADKSLQAAKGIVEGTGMITGGSLKATKYIVDKGSGGVVTITSASFESKLSEANRGAVTLKVKGTFSGEPLDSNFTINLPSPQATVEKFARELLK